MPSKSCFRLADQYLSFLYVGLAISVTLKTVGQMGRMIVAYLNEGEYLLG